MREPVQCYICFKGLSKKQKHRKIKNIEMNSSRSKAGFFHSVRGKSIKPPLERIYLHVYRQELFCNATSYLQLTELQNSSKAMKNAGPHKVKS